MDFSAREWRKIWEHLYNEGEVNLSGRISHEVGHIWNSDNWDRNVTLDFDAEDAARIKEVAKMVGVFEG